MFVNGVEVKEEDASFSHHRIKILNESLLNQGQDNTISFQFQNTFVDNSAGLHKYVDPKDKRTYIFSHCEPYFCHRWFPCFDQPSVRATLDLKVLAPEDDWVVIANGTHAQKMEVSCIPELDGMLQPSKMWLHTFEQCPPISSYIYNMCAGQFLEIVD